jgi:hypothetical protein
VHLCVLTYLHHRFDSRRPPSPAAAVRFSPFGSAWNLALLSAVASLMLSAVILGFWMVSVSESDHVRALTIVMLVLGVVDCACLYVLFAVAVKHRVASAKNGAVQVQDGV